MKKNDYAEKLRDPRWQKKRLEILARDGWECKWCGDKESTLHVHHLWYTKNDPWDAEDVSLITLCESCHETETEDRKGQEETLLGVVRRTRLSAGDVLRLAGAINESKITDEVTWSEMCWAFFHDGMREEIHQKYHEWLASAGVKP